MVMMGVVHSLHVATQFSITAQISAGRVLTFRFQVGVGAAGELELTPEHLSVVHVNQVVNALLDHVRLRAERRDDLVTEQPLPWSQKDASTQNRPKINVLLQFSQRKSERPPPSACLGLFALAHVDRQRDSTTETGIGTLK